MHSAPKTFVIVGLRWYTGYETSRRRSLFDIDHAEELSCASFWESFRPDMRWPLSTSFYKLISKTADRGKAQYTLPAPGLLTPDRQYYWHVRAKNDKGVWGPWSKTWSFTAQGPTYPLEVTLSYDLCHRSAADHL
jgi:hypothetical protein